MSGTMAQARPVESHPSADLGVIPALLLFAAIAFNPALAVVNAHVTPLNQASIIGAELTLVVAAHLVAIANYRPQMLTWYALLATVLLFAAYRSIMLEQIEAKYVRDVLLIPTFIVLGMTFAQRNLTRVVVLIHAVVLIVLVIEALDTAAYSDLFRIQDYYINTRGYDTSNFWNKESDLYVSATRPDSRIFSFVYLHRLSSIFLEPVSLGYYCIIIIAYVCARFSSLTLTTRVFLIGGTIVALIGCDGRLAFAASVLIIAASFAAPCLPRYSAVLYLPGALGAAFLIVNLGGFHAGTDDFPGRIAHTIELLKQFGATEFFGISDEKELLSKAVDSGIAYLIITQSILATAILWMFIVFGSAERTREQIRLTHATGIYLSLVMMVSFAFLTIKTAALLWFIYGALQASRHPAEQASQVSRSGGRTPAWPRGRVPAPSIGRTFVSACQPGGARW
jgi:putative polymerase